jgi:hypothetical protein
MDGGIVAKKDDLVPSPLAVCAALRDILDEYDISQTALALRVSQLTGSTVSQGRVSAWSLGRSVPDLKTVLALQEGLADWGVPRGALLTRAGYVDGAPSVPLAIDLDATLSAKDKATLRDVYDAIKRNASTAPATP